MHEITTYSILLSPRYRIARYVWLSISLFIFSYSEILYHYSGVDNLPFFILVMSGFLCKFILSILLITALTPLLLRQRYLVFWALTLSLIFIFRWLQHMTFEDLICRYFQIPTWKEKVHNIYIAMDILSQNALWIMALLGILMGRMLKYWNKEYAYKLQLQESGLQMETEAMKEQVSSSLLCSTLRKSGEFAEAAPKETSATLMRLSRLLRYQLYDSRHEKVLLESEIKFMKEYLSILQYNAGCSAFNLSVSGRTMGVVIPPLLFVPFLQSESTPDSQAFIDISIRMQDNTLTFELRDNQSQRNDVNVRKRLEQLYPGKHSLSIEPNYVLLNIQIQN